MFEPGTFNALKTILRTSNIKQIYRCFEEQLKYKMFTGFTNVHKFTGNGMEWYVDTHRNYTLLKMIITRKSFTDVS